ncbi:MAG: phosphoribosylanthranilate isomerase [Sphingomonadales bacterium]|nr:phosphoribosylanthranilate isomerase [Sphingomonadales bacterium]MBK9268545.1 phosphoribosylanthranilate isomerase [Sphingomonadales bacterium]MBP6434549.1 phosphoribosylanthranilate isomerase [Sphingorhabdus sp.]
MPEQTQIKICGLSNEAAIDAAATAGATHIGLVHFEKSPRHVSLELAAALRMRTPPSLKVVLLLVNADPQLTDRALGMVRPDVVQFHGTETPEWLVLVRQHSEAEIWKAIGLNDRQTLVNANRFAGVADRLLFDAPAQALPGGTGTRVDWSLLSHFEHRTPWGLAGGLAPDNVAEALRATRAPLVDVSSGVESAPGVKDVDKIAAFCQAVRDFSQ